MLHFMRYVALLLHILMLFLSFHLFGQIGILYGKGL